MKENIVQKKSFEFAIRAVNAYKYLTGEKKEYIISKQFLRSGISVGAKILKRRLADNQKLILFPSYQ
jgi:four helix bundle protein